MSISEEKEYTLISYASYLFVSKGLERGGTHKAVFTNDRNYKGL